MNSRLLQIALIALIAAPLHAQEAEPQTDPKPQQSETQSADAPAPLTRGLAGPYLAARMAAMDNDYRAAAQYFGRALGQDEGDGYLQDSALVAMISAGEMEPAIALAQRSIADGDATELAVLVNWAALAKQGKWDALLPAFDRMPKRDAAQDPQGEGNLLDGLLKAWALLGAGKASDSAAAFDRMARIPGARPIVAYQVALAKAMVGDYETADKLLTREAAADHIMGVVARVEILSQLEQNATAITLLEAQPGFADEPGLVALRDRLASGETLAFDSVKSATDGMAQVFLTFAAALASTEEPDPLSLIQARLATYLSPDLGEARLLTAQLLQSLGQYDLAEQEFDTLRDQGNMRPIAELSRIDALTRAERLDDAEKAALALTAAHPELAPGWIALGDLLRQQDKFSQAVPAYDKALSLMKDAGRARWFPLYARGIALERSGQFPKAEQDFRAALEIQPDSASVLNYLGYSLVDRGERLDEALPMIQRAVELKPDDGYILDSLAWAYFRLGRYDEAVAPMERSVSLMASDPLVNDHMGDIYWMAGRKREAEIQWQRALSLKPETEAEDNRIRAKLERGLDEILAEEKADGGLRPPTKPSDEPADEPPAENGE